MKKGLGLMAILVAPILLLITGCGSGEGGAGTAAVVVSTVSGVAAAGVPLNGTVKLKDSSSPANELSDTIAADGSFSFNVDGLKPPFILKAQGTAGGTNYYLYSFSAGPGIANINPFTKLAVANAAGRADLATLYSAPPAATMQTIAANLAKAIADIQNKLQPLLDSYNTTSYSATANPVSGLYAANHLGLDCVFDMVKVNISSTGTVTLINKLTNAVFFTGSVSNFMEGILDTTKIPQPPVVVIISPPAPTVTTNGTIPFVASVFYTSNTQVTWSVVEGSAGGTINSAGVYTAPATAGGGPYHVKAMSVADSTKSDTSTVTVNGLVGVTISPSPTTVTVNGTKNLSATVTGTSNTQVVWSVVEAGGGTINQSGVYTAPATVGTYHVKAVSLADPTKSATATVTVAAASPPPTSGPFPIGTWYGPNGVSFTVKQAVSSGRYSGTVNWPGLPGNGTVDIQGNELLNFIVSQVSGLLTIKVDITDTSGVFVVGLVLKASSDQKSLTGTMILYSTKPGYTTPLNIDNAVFANTQPTTSVSVAISPTGFATRRINS